jgi:dTDP-glucose 4,6-dehydratase
LNDYNVINDDKLAYAGNLANLNALKGVPHHIFVQIDIGDRALVSKLLAEHKWSSLNNPQTPHECLI